jgi:hypothetical protein
MKSTSVIFITSVSITLLLSITLVAHSQDKCLQDRSKGEVPAIGERVFAQGYFGRVTNIEEDQSITIDFGWTRPPFPFRSWGSTVLRSEVVRGLPCTDLYVVGQQLYHRDSSGQVLGPYFLYWIGEDGQFFVSAKGHNKFGNYYWKAGSAEISLLGKEYF